MSEKLTWVPVSLNTPELVALNERRETAKGVARETEKAFIQKATEFLNAKGVTAPAGHRIVFAFKHGVAIAFAKDDKGSKGSASKGLTL
jgi:hypothetical protein